MRPWYKQELCNGLVHGGLRVGGRFTSAECLTKNGKDSSCCLADVGRQPSNDLK